MLRYALTALAALFTATPCSARTWHILPDGTGDAPTIQAGIDSSTAGDVVELADGEYTGPGNRDISYDGKSITVRSAGGAPEACVIDCQGSQSEPHRGFHFHGSEDATAFLQGVTIRNGFATRGGGVLCEPIGTTGSRPSIENCVIENCHADYGGGLQLDHHCHSFVSTTEFRSNDATFTGGAIGAYESSPTCMDLMIIDNTAHEGGGVQCTRSQATFERSTFMRNVSLFGGAIQLYDSCRATVRDCSFEGNGSSWYGGGALRSDTNSSATISGSNFSGNTGKSGGAVYCEPSSVTSSAITACEFTANSATEYGGALYGSASVESCAFVANQATVGNGGGAYFTSRGVAVFDCLFVGNSAASGGGIGAVSLSGSLIIGNTTVASNHAEIRGGGISALFSDLEFNRSVVWGNCAGLGYDQVEIGLGAAAAFSCSDVDSTGLGPGPASWDGTTNLYVDPDFCVPASCNAAPTAKGDYGLAAGSPCLPQNNSCGVLIGTSEPGCNPDAVAQKTWSQIKAAYR